MGARGCQQEEVRDWPLGDRPGTHRSHSGSSLGAQGPTHTARSRRGRSPAPTATRQGRSGCTAAACHRRLPLGMSPALQGPGELPPSPAPGNPRALHLLFSHNLRSGAWETAPKTPCAGEQLRAPQEGWLGPRALKAQGQEQTAMWLRNRGRRRGRRASTAPEKPLCVQGKRLQDGPKSHR